MSRYYTNSGGSSTKALNLTASATSKKMTTRRQADHESGFYEQGTDETHFAGCHTSTSSGGSGKRTRQPSAEQYMNGGRSKRQKVNMGMPSAAHIVAQGQSKSHRQAAPLTVTTNSKQEQRNQYYANNNNNSKRYLPSQMPPQQQSQHQQVTSTSVYKKTTANNNNNNNNNINNNKNNYYIQLSAKMNTLPVAETIEVPDSSDSDDDDVKSNRREVASGGNKERLANGGGASTGIPTLIISGSSSSNSNSHLSATQQQLQNKFKYEQQQQQSANGASSSGQTANKNRESNRKADAPNNSNNAELERIQREIEEVTLVHTKCNATEDEKVNLSHFKLIRVLGTG
ncbi:PREDICTED: myb-like protein U, partial [Rhagoletis zephyria]|uniref:myb-like protein U n=1 Tax=Rhagoletis zephyria TaxID=28612 RepID=UPI00081170DB